jgi:phosphatidylserine decarboxylase
MFDFVIIGIVGAFLILLPISLKWELNIKTTIIYNILIGVLVGYIVFFVNQFAYWNIVNNMIFGASLIVVFSILMLLWRFYRDPERNIPDDDNAVISPADGRIIYIKKIEDGEIPISTKLGKNYKLYDLIHTEKFKDARYQIGILMTYLDVHVNRSPVSGKVEMIKHIKGSFKSLKRIESIFENERSMLIIRGKKFPVAVVQIASRLVRMIVLFVKEDQFINKGYRIGRIRFGSQVDLILPDIKNLEILVNINDTVIAGETVLAKLKEEGNTFYENQ